MRYCKKCLMPDTRPGIKFDKNGVCYPCLNAKKKKKIDWAKRYEELVQLCTKHRRNDGGYDCIIPVSGGKDSWYQVYMMKREMQMNPLLVNVSNYSWTDTGKQNFFNMLKAFQCNIESLIISPEIARKMTRRAFERLGSPTWYFDRCIYTWPLQVATEKNIPLVVYGENINYEYGGGFTEETPSALEQVNNDVVKPYPLKDWCGDGITMEDMQPCVPKTSGKWERTNSGLIDNTWQFKHKVAPIYLSYYVPWSGYNNMKKARELGFKTLEDTHEWIRQGYIEQYDQIDSKGYLVHPWLKYPKYGHARVTDVASCWIREGRLKRDEGIRWVKAHDHKLDPEALEDFLKITGYSSRAFFEICDKIVNEDIFLECSEDEATLMGKYKLRSPIWQS